MTESSPYSFTPLWLVAALYLAIGAMWAMAVPPYEKPDELNHAAYIELIGREHRLPVQTREHPFLLENMAHQPPLYYAVAAVVAESAHVLGMPRVSVTTWDHRSNPDYAGGTGSVAETVFLLHGDAGDPYLQTPPWDVLLTRAVSLVMGLATVLGTYAVGMRVFGRRRWPALAAASLVAFLPQFAFLTSSTTNDPLSWSIAAWFLVLLLDLREASGSDVHRRYVLLGVLAGLGLITKATLVCLPPLVLLVKPRSMPRARHISCLALFATTTMLISGWWFLRNIYLYGDVLGRQEIVNPRHYLWNVAQRSLASPYFRSTFITKTGKSVVGYFGHVHIPMPAQLYRVVAAIAASSAIGVVLYARRVVSARGSASRSADAVALTLLTAMPAIALALLVMYNLSVEQPQGRYLFTALPAISCLFLIGVSELGGALRFGVRAMVSAGSSPWVLGARTSAVLIAAMVALNLYALFAVVVPVYGQLAWTTVPWR